MFIAPIVRDVPGVKVLNNLAEAKILPIEEQPLVSGWECFCPKVPLLARWQLHAVKSGSASAARRRLAVSMCV